MSGSVSMVDGHIDPDTGITIPEMTPQEALELLNNVEFAEQYQGKDEYGTMLLLCKDALLKQIPKKPIGDGWGSYLKLCPNCKSKEIYDHKDLKHRKRCDDCGQALDWSDRE